jgi:glyoxylase-like metal-dependent hydrolase (beta-lactamase superfamily II)
MKKTLVSACVVVLAALPARGQGNDFSKVEIKTTKVAGSISMLQGAGGNIGVSAGADGVLVVDDEFLPLADKIKAAIKALSPAGKLAFLVNTHWHGDHTGGNSAFGKEATIVAQLNVRKRLMAPQEGNGRTTEAAPKEALPIVTFEDGVTLWFNGEEIEVVHVPHGHTDGDSIIFFKGSNVVHMGDQFFNGMFPFIDVSSGGDVAGYVKNVADTLARIPADAKIIPGHGPLGTVDDLKKFHTMLAKTVDFVRQEIAKGMTLEEAKNAGLPEDWKGYATSFVTTERWVETVYTSLKK